MHSVRRFEDVLMDIALNTREINILADMITEYQTEVLRVPAGAGAGWRADGRRFRHPGGAAAVPRTAGSASSRRATNGSWRRAREPGVDIFFHTCGQVCDLLPDLADLGFNAALAADQPL